MTEKARRYRPSHVRRLDTLSRNECAAPDCGKALIAHDGETVVSKICHIEAASKKGPRFNPAMDVDDRRHYNNLILLCDECHGIIDNLENESDYPVRLLREWKKEHESKGLTALNARKSLLMLAINAIASSDLEEDVEGEDADVSVFDIESKISYNEIVRNKPLIDEYKIFYTKIASLYSELERQGSFKKERLLRNIRRLYLKTRGSYILEKGDPIEAVKKNADSIIEDIEEELVVSCSSENTAYDEDIAFGVSIIMVDAFMRCKILEEPPLS